ncbi:RNA dependent RNA polymerase-domain-containing protein [Trichophaea hybrida]|nr:RNA dependent RNA polymerase-domain-containing protein [Trichophaea hybrida]
MMEVLNDHNIRTKPLQAFRVNCNRSQLRPIYTYLDQELEMDEGNNEHLQRPSLTFPVRYQLEVCISHGYLNEHNITPKFIHRLQGMEERDARILLECVQERKTRVYDPMDIFTTQRDKRADSTKSIPETCVYMRRATVTPTGILFQTPSVEVSNRVIRKYHRHADRFLRVSFTDEKLLGRIRHTDKEASNELFTRVYRALEQGIVIGDRRYEFLAFGNSQLREHGTYFFAPIDNLTPDAIREWMGYFDRVKVVAKYASRLGQCFSTTKASKSCKEVKCSKIPDIERNSYKFTDGVGKISPALADLLTDEMVTRKPSPDYQVSCFQFRLAGCKGVLAVDPSVPEDEVHLRETQEKFWSKHSRLEIIRCSGFASAALNRQLIQVMSSLGVPDEYFRKRVRTMLRDYTEAEFNPAKALQLLMKTIDANQMTPRIANLVRGGFMDSQEPFVMSLIRLWRAWTVKYLKEKAKIPLDYGAFLLGVVDETATLRGYHCDAPEDELPQIFCQILCPQTKEPQVITGRCIVARNPSLHPGDVRIVEAVDCPELHHLVDVVVFPQTGDRDVPNMLSGGDLDGDDYVVIWDKELIAPGILINEPPASYTAVTAEKLSRPVEISDIRKFFVEYMKNDRLGAIANAHLAWADRYPEGVKSGICLELAQLHSDAVDYPKSGVKARMQKRHRIRSWPHFFEKPKEERSHKSYKILGQLYDLVERIDFTPRYDLQPNERLMYAFELTLDELREAKEVKGGYDSAIRRIMAQFDIKSEFEVWSTFVMSHCNNNDYKFHEEIGEISFLLKERFRKEVLENCPDRSQLPRKVAAMYVITALEIEDAKKSQQEEHERMTPRCKGNPPPMQLSKEDIERLPLMSFPWLFPEILVDISHGRLMVPTDYEPDYDDASWTQETEFEEVPIASLTIGSDIAVSDEDSEANSNHGSDVELENIVVEY